MMDQVANDVVEDGLAKPAVLALPQDNDTLLQRTPQETTEQYATRLLSHARESLENLSQEQRDELILLADVITARVLSFENVAASMRARSEAIGEEAQRIQKIADALALLANELADAVSDPAERD